MKKPFFFFINLFFFCVPAFAASSTPQGEGNVGFRWAFCAKIEEKGEQGIASIAQDMALGKEDRVKLYLKPAEGTFVYVIHQDAHGGVHLIFPQGASQFDSNGQASRGYYFPEREEWMDAGGPNGAGTFYLLASSQRLVDLEALLRSHEFADPGRKLELAGQIVSEIRDLGRDHKQFKTTAERPVNIIGQLRGGNGQEKQDPMDIASRAVDISANDFYGKSFTITLSTKAGNP